MECSRLLPPTKSIYWPDVCVCGDLQRYVLDTGMLDTVPHISTINKQLLTRRHRDVGYRTSHLNYKQTTIDAKARSCPNALPCRKIDAKGNRVLKKHIWSVFVAFRGQQQVILSLTKRYSAVFAFTCGTYDSPKPTTEARIRLGVIKLEFCSHS